MAARHSRAVARALALERSDKLAQACGSARVRALECSKKLALAHGHGDDCGVGGAVGAGDAGGLAQALNCSTASRSRAQLEEAEHRLSLGFHP